MVIIGIDDKSFFKNMVTNTTLFGKRDMFNIILDSV